MIAIIGPTYIKALTIIETPSFEGIVLSFVKGRHRAYIHKLLHTATETKAIRVYFR